MFSGTLTTAKHLQNKRFIKRTEGNPGGVVAVEVCARAIPQASSQNLCVCVCLCVCGVRTSLACMQSPLHYSNVRLVDPVTGKKVRTISRFQADGSKVGAQPCACLPAPSVRHADMNLHHSEQVRVSTGKLASGSIIQRPEILSQRRRPTPLAGTSAITICRTLLLLFCSSVLCHAAHCTSVHFLVGDLKACIAC